MRRKRRKQRETMKNRFILALAVLSLTACHYKQQVPEKAVRTMCEQIVKVYPAATLQDVYKTCYQDFFGPGHMVTDSASALGYIHYEVEELRSEGLTELESDTTDEPTGFRHRFVRVDLRRIVLGELSEEELLRRFIEAANTSTPVHDNWADEWSEIERIALQVHPAWADTDLQTALREAAQANRAVHQSEAYRNTYHPHYRIIIKE